jgi:subtilase family serine protease
MNATNRPQIITVTVDAAATQNDEGDNGEECSGDIEMSVAMAPGLNAIYVFENGESAADNSYFDDILAAMVTYTNILQFSCSWGGSTAQDLTSETLFKQMILQGQSFFDASGDWGAFVGAVQFPSDSPSIMQVGGTTLTDGASPNYPWAGEVVWAPYSGPNVSGYYATSSSGGISTYYAIPAWQTNFNMTTNLGSKTYRNFPDIAANADNDYLYTDDGTNGSPQGGWGGTSFAAPLWAALTAMMNQQAAGCGEAPVGFLNPSLYALAQTTNYANCLHDITSGNNTWRGSKTMFYAVPGFDLCCGLGTPTGTNLINALAPPVLAVVTNVPANYEVFSGQSVTLSATFKGAAPFTYQWTFNGVPLSNGAGITGATSNVLTLNPAVAGNAGSYQLLAANAYGTGQSGLAVLKVDASPKLSGPRKSGQSFVFSYPTVAGASYQLQSKTNLLAGAWIPVGSPVTGTGATNSITNSINSTIVFYRLLITP